MCISCFMKQKFWWFFSVWETITMGKLLPNKIVEERRAICKSCKYYKSMFSICGKCGCYMPLKTKYDNSFCPIGKWIEYVEEKK